MQYDAVIIGAGPGGLSCAAELAEGGVKTLVLERKTRPGPKVCAGGITWSGLIKTVPGSLIEKKFPCQNIYSRLQQTAIHERMPVIATVSRATLGDFMAEKALKAGAHIVTATNVRRIDAGCNIHTSSRDDTQAKTYTCTYLIGADGSSSLVRRHLGLASGKTGMGITYQLNGEYEEMEWHLNTRYFGNGYAWIFPHARSFSLGAYIPAGTMLPTELKENLKSWASARGIVLEHEKCSAGLINYDFQGCHFGNVHLVGDAAGLASPLTGEGIYPAIVSGKAVAAKILKPHLSSQSLERLIRRQQRFSRMVSFTGKSRVAASLLAEVGVAALRARILSFRALEMS